MGAPQSSKGKNRGKSVRTWQEIRTTAVFRIELKLLEPKSCGLTITPCRYMLTDFHRQAQIGELKMKRAIGWLGIEP